MTRSLMRVVGGRLKGRNLASPSSRDIRPTADRLRESLFNILVHAYDDPIADARVLDLFAGTGALGIEAVSRGAKFTLFVDNGAEARALLRNNVEALGLGGVTKVYRRDATDLGPAHPVEPFSLVFLDPPYAKKLAEKALASLRDGGWLTPGALLVVEEAKAAAFAAPDGFEELERRAYDDTEFVFLRAGSNRSLSSRGAAHAASRMMKSGLLHPSSARDDAHLRKTTVTFSRTASRYRQLQFHIGRPAVIALAGIRRVFHFAQQRVHLFRLEAAAGAHRAVAGHGGGDMHQAALQRQRLVPFRHVLGEIAQQRSGIGLAEQRRRLAHRDRAGAEGFDRQPERRQFLGAIDQLLHRRLVEFDDLRNQQDLPLHAVPRQRGLQLFIDDALMRGVLVHHDQAVAGLRHDIGLVDLRPRRAQRAIEQIGGGAS